MHRLHRPVIEGYMVPRHTCSVTANIPSARERPLTRGLLIIRPSPFPKPFLEIFHAPHPTAHWRSAQHWFYCLLKSIEPLTMYKVKLWNEQQTAHKALHLYILLWLFWTLVQVVFNWLSIHANIRNIVRLHWRGGIAIQCLTCVFVHIRICVWLALSSFMQILQANYATLMALTN